MSPYQTKSILFKLILVMAVLSGLVLLSSLVSWLVFDRVSYFQQVLSSETIPNEKTTRSLNNLSGQLVKISVSLDEPKSPEFIVQAQAQLDALSAELDLVEENNLVGSSNAPNDALVDMLQSIHALYDNVRSQLDIQRQLLKQQSRFSNEMDNATRAVTRALAMLKVAYAKQAVDNLTPTNNTRSDRAVYITLTELRQGMQTLEKTLQELLVGAFDQQAGAVERRYRDQLRKVSLLMLDLPEPVLLPIVGSVDNVANVYSQKNNVFRTAKEMANLSDKLNVLYRKSVNASIAIEQKKSAINEQADNALDDDFNNIVGAIWAAKVTLLTMVVLSLLTALLVYYLFIKPKIIARIQQLTDSTLHIANGDYRTVISDDSGDEISAMTNALDIFRKALIEKQLFEKQLVDNERRLSTIIDESVQGLFTVDESMNIVSANPACRLIFNYTPEEMLTKSALDLFPDSRELFVFKPEYAKVEEGDGLLVCREEDVLAVAATDVFFMACVSVTLINVSEGLLFSCFVSDVTEQRQSRKKIEDLVSELQESNADLESFAYSCSHDLQEPVRIVVNFSMLLQNHLKNSEDEKVQKYLGFITEASSNSQQLIRDILDYSRLAKAGDKKVNVLMSDVFESVDAMVSADKIDGASLAFVGGDVTVRAVRSNLQQLLLNLVSNGFKFNRSETPTVTVTVIEQIDHWLISVQDNGIGIEPAYHEQIFQLFKRLTTRSEFPGSGIGLAKCQRIAQKSNGTIWIDSEVGKGSTFYVRLSKLMPEDQKVLAGRAVEALMANLPSAPS